MAALLRRLKGILGSSIDARRDPQRRRLARAAEAWIRADPRLGRLLEVAPRSASTGAGMTDYHALAAFILARRPRRVLEFGGGVTTVAMGLALAELNSSAGGEEPCRLVSMEDVPKYHGDLRRLMPEDLAPWVSLRLSPKRESLWRGVLWGFHYESLPEGDFDFVFVDGPSESRDGRKGACLDLLYLLERQKDAPVDVIVDYKLSSLEAYQSVLPPGAVGFDPTLRLGVLRGVRGADLSQGPPKPSRVRRVDAYRALGIAPP